MTKTAHRVYITLLSLIVLASLIFLIYEGSSYYRTVMEERFFHVDHSSLKPSGPLGHGLGILGSLLMIIGVSIYMARKRMRSLSRLGILKHWLEFHIFLCTLGPIMVLFHTSFKFGGLVAISFWSMVAVFLSGIIGRFIYIQIPRSIEGRELSLGEVREMKTDIGYTLRASMKLSDDDHKEIMLALESVQQENKESTMSHRQAARKIKSVLTKNKTSKAELKKIMQLVRNDITLSKRIARLQTMQNLFKYWHVAHLPFALVMLIIMLIHVVVTLTFGYRWIF